MARNCKKDALIVVFGNAVMIMSILEQERSQLYMRWSTILHISNNFFYVQPSDHKRAVLV
jgi:hypothetical protein